MKVCACLVVAMACGGKTEPPVPPPSHTTLAPDAAPVEDVSDRTSITTLRDDMCKCTDKACVDSVQARMKELVTKAPPSDRSNTDVHATNAKLEREYGECMVRALTAPPP